MSHNKQQDELGKLIWEIYIDGRHDQLNDFPAEPTFPEFRARFERLLESECLKALRRVYADNSGEVYIRTPGGFMALDLYIKQLQEQDGFCRRCGCHYRTREEHENSPLGRIRHPREQEKK